MAISNRVVGMALFRRQNLSQGLKEVRKTDTQWGIWDSRQRVLVSLRKCKEAAVTGAMGTRERMC